MTEPDLPSPSLSPSGPRLYLISMRHALAELAYGARHGRHPERVERYTRELADALTRLEAFLNRPHGGDGEKER